MESGRPLFSPDSVSMSATSHALSAPPSSADLLYTEIEALHLSRQDNPFIQKISASQDNLDSDCLMGENRPSFTRCNSTSVVSSNCISLMSPEPPCSPTTRSSDPLVLNELHSHLIRSPPPITWPERNLPLSPRSNGTFSPDSTDDDCNPNYYTRSQSEEHILSPCRDLLRAGMFSPTRGVTPELLMTSSLHAAEPPLDLHSPRTTKQKVKRNFAVVATSGEEHVASPFRSRFECKY